MRCGFWIFRSRNGTFWWILRQRWGHNKYSWKNRGHDSMPAGSTATCMMHGYRLLLLRLALSTPAQIVSHKELFAVNRSAYTFSGRRMKNMNWRLMTGVTFTVTVSSRGHPQSGSVTCLMCSTGDVWEISGARHLINFIHRRFPTDIFPRTSPPDNAPYWRFLHTFLQT